MNNKKNKGVSLLILVITIAMMSVIIAITLNTSIKSIEEANTTKIENEIRDLKEAINIRVSNYEISPSNYPLIGDKVGDKVFDYLRTISNKPSSEVDTIILNVSGDYSEENSNMYRIVGRNDAEKLGVQSIDFDHYYIIDYYQKEVYGPVQYPMDGGI